MTHPDMREKKQVTARMTEQFAKDLNLIMACTRQDSATAVVQDAVHQLAEYYRVAMQRKWQSNAEVETFEQGEIEVLTKGV